MNLLLTGAFAWNEKELNELRHMGHEVVFMQQEKDALPCSAEWVEGIIGNGIFLYHPIEQFTSLRYIQLTSAGFDRVPMEYVKTCDISIYNARGVYSVPMAEFAISGVLQLFKQSRFFEDSQRYHEWNKNRNLRELYGKQVCIVGCGSVGTECAKRFGAFGCEIIGVDVVPYESEHFDKMVELTNLDAVLSESDVVVLTVPLTEETFHLMDADRLSQLKDTAVLVNIARGAVVDTDALIDVLNVKKQMGAVLDVFEIEPLGAKSPLWDMENVVITPHNSFVGEGNHERMCNVIVENLKRYGQL